MSELLNRINSVIGNTNTEPWQALLALHSSDPEAFYELACLQQFCDVPTSVEAIAKLARQVRIAVWQSYQFEPTADGARLVVYDGPIIPIPGEIALRVKEFLRVVSGKTTSDTPGKDFLGREVSDAELQFKIEPPSGREFPVTTPLDSAPRVLRVAEEDAQSLKTQPAYVTYGLLHCARRVVLAPTSVFCGLRRGQGGVQSINSGFAICGEPRLLYDNQGASSAAPAGFVYVVYCDAEGFVFDWDWVREGSSGHPRDSGLRFGDPQRQERDLVLDLPSDLSPGQFDRTVATYSNRGDCIFCYFLEGVSFADRINSDLTVFWRF